MTCEYFSEQNGNVSCKIYGILNVTREKKRECISNPFPCSEVAILEMNKKNKLRAREESQESGCFRNNLSQRMF